MDTPGGPLADPAALLGADGLREALAKVERALLAHVLRRHAGNVSASALRLRIHRVTMIRKVACYGLYAQTSRRRGRPPGE